ncbi:MAG: hypothetical protein SCH71_03700 [Desulfobulbaceae bacterium]|nr:hypothetical protein [Desulfobulbaceae bacterium]
MKIRKKAVILTLVGAFLAAGINAWGANGKQGGKPPDGDPADPTTTPIVGYYFWRLGHMDGPHDSSKALGISRDGKVAVGATDVVDFIKAFRLDIDWAISTGDGMAPLYNELQVQENMGNGTAYAASNMVDDTGAPVLDCSSYEKVSPEDGVTTNNFDWCGSKPVGTLMTGTVSYAAEWQGYLDPSIIDLGPDYVAIPDFGGGISDMRANGVSADGMIFVGTGNTKTGQQAFLADMATATTDETGETIVVPVQLTIQEVIDGVVGQTLQTSSAQAVSADGTIIAGYGGTKTGNKAFVTIFGGTEVDEAGNVTAILTSTILPTIPSGKFAEAYAMTTVTDETSGETTAIYVAGRSDSPKGPQACIWFQGDDPNTTDVVENWVVKGIGGLSTKKYNSVATGIVHRPGSTAGELMVVGTTQTILYPSEAFVWTGNPVLVPDGPYTWPDGTVHDYIGYMYDLEKILTKTGAAEASSAGSAWILNEGTGVALSNVVNAGDNGPSARIVGWGTNPEGGIEAWLVTNYPYDDLVFVKE